MSENSTPEPDSNELVETTNKINSEVTESDLKKNTRSTIKLNFLV